MPTPKYLLPTSRRNTALGEIVNCGLDPADFDWTEVNQERQEFPDLIEEGIVSVLVHRPTGHSFTFDLRTSEPYVRFSPGKDTLRCFEWCKNLLQVMGYFVGWLLALKIEAEAPDLWSDVVRPTRILAAAKITEDQAFEPRQRLRIAERLEEIKLSVQATVHDDQTAAFVENRFRYLEDNLAKQTQSQWIHTFIGVMFTVVATACPEEVQELFSLASDKLTFVVDGVARLLN